jgi:hypothetical protein
MTYVFFQPLDLLAQRCLRHGQTLGGSTEMKSLRHRQEVSKMA